MLLSIENTTATLKQTSSTSEFPHLRGKQREREVVWLRRRVAIYLMREETGASLSEIGTELGGYDYVTVMYGWEKVQSEVANNDRVRREIDEVLAAIQKKS